MPQRRCCQRFAQRYYPELLLVPWRVVLVINGAIACCHSRTYDSPLDPGSERKPPGNRRHCSMAYAALHPTVHVQLEMQVPQRSAMSPVHPRIPLPPARAVERMTTPGSSVQQASKELIFRFTWLCCVNFAQARFTTAGAGVDSSDAGQSAAVAVMRVRELAEIACRARRPSSAPAPPAAQFFRCLLNACAVWGLWRQPASRVRCAEELRSGPWNAAVYVDVFPLR